MFNRRNFIKASGIVAIPAFLPGGLKAGGHNNAPANTPAVKFFGDGQTFEPVEYMNELQKFNGKEPIKRDNYGTGGTVEALEKRMAELTGKEKAIFMPTGTMANEFAIAVLSGDNSKIFVQDTSHIYRDEADSAQTVHNKRLMPLAKDRAYFTQQELQKAIEGVPSEEAFKTGIGAVAIENPVRRTSGTIIPIEEIRKISAYCKSAGIKCHLDGARLMVASAWSGISVKEYASYFDTVYISLYKYLGANAGAILCGKKEVIDKMPHMMKVHGGAMYNNWSNAAMALHRLEGFEERHKQAIKKSEQLFAQLK